MPAAFYRGSDHLATCQVIRSLWNHSSTVSISLMFDMNSQIGYLITDDSEIKAEYTNSE